MPRKCDVLIVGAGTTGIYFGWLMAKRGHAVLIIEKDAPEQVGQRLEVIHFHKKTMEELNIPTPIEPPEFMFPYKGVIVSRLPLFLQRMYEVVESDGVQFEFTCEFKELLFEKKKIVGAKVEKDNEEFEILARLVVDASGIACAVRSTLPEDYGMETWKYDSHNRFFVILHYIKWSNPDDPHPQWGDVVPYYYLFFDPGYTRDEAIMGIAGPESFEKAAALVEELLEREKYPPYELKKKEFGYFPYSRVPYTLVGNGFFCVGDSASVTHPVMARGIAETWRLCKNVEEVFDAALKQGEYITKEMLWEANVRHFRNEGAERAYLYMISSAIYSISEKELNYLLEKLRPIVDPPEEAEDAGEDVNLSLGTMFKIVLKVLWGVLSRKVSVKGLSKFIKVNGKAKKIKKHYKKYPEHPEDFEEWVQKANELWEKREHATREFKSTTATYP
ncbi:MAG: FAD-dependent monooxygenase [Candidatus Helarchaeota archaeon]|nr:FAD-dependent monooxygenase [Candidatus Helarchaeota archaeon]